ncbi:MAG: hypothetical protein KC933_04125 [Myxococcales bacterium]|nr:hypothetical protein [Myxococcales bacterium]MCB9647452.1 hypothetical protein [Deltaproteobacteria bacterium]
MSDGEPRYDDKAVARILLRATELQEHQGDSLSLAQVHEIAQELGIPRALVAQAVAEVAPAPRAGPEARWLGGRDALLFEAEVPGHVDDAAFEEVLDTVRRTLGNPGSVETVGAARIWSTNRDTTRRVHLTLTEVRAKDGRLTTRIRLDERMPGDARQTVGGSLVGAFFLSSLGLAAVSSLVGKALVGFLVGPILGGGLLAGYLVGRGLWKARSRGRELALGEALDQILRRLDDGAPRSLEPGDDPLALPSGL